MSDDDSELDAKLGSSRISNLLKSCYHEYSAILTFSTYLTKKGINPDQILMVPLKLVSEDRILLTRFEILYVYRADKDVNVQMEGPGYCHSLRLEGSESELNKYLDLEKKVAIEYMIPTKIYNTMIKKE